MAQFIKKLEALGSKEVQSRIDLDLFNDKNRKSAERWLKENPNAAPKKPEAPKEQEDNGGDA